MAPTTPHSPRLRSLVAIAIAVAALSAAPARADDEPAAREAYREGSRQFDLGEYQAALDAFKRAYLNFESPAFLYNIAQCHKALGNRTEAIRFYKTYLRMSPDAQDRVEIERIIADLEASPAQQPKPPAPDRVAAPDAPPPPPPTGPRDAPPRRLWPWLVAAAAAVVAVGVGITAAVLATRHPSFSPTLPELTGLALVHF